MAPPAPPNCLLLTAVFDGPLNNKYPRGVELYATCDIPDLSAYGLGSANGGGGTDGQEFTFPAASASEGQFIYVSREEEDFAIWFGFAPSYTTPAMLISGDDAIELFYGSAVVDVYGDINVDGTNEAWEEMFLQHFTKKIKFAIKPHGK